ncbi:MAG: hypothetical protein IPK78_05440 [Rhodospirillales bacterium]|nr:hypothetical protein [Rhodospirillales bacterium]
MRSRKSRDDQDFDVGKRMIELIRSEDPVFISWLEMRLGQALHQASCSRWLPPAPTAAHWAQSLPDDGRRSRSCRGPAGCWRKSPAQATARAGAAMAEALTDDRLLGGRVRLRQPADGFPHID